MIFLLDNYDSFTFNLYQALRELDAEVTVVRNDQVTVEEVAAMAPDLDGIVLSPGPCTPAEAGISVPLVRRLAGRVPILGVCLGHQAIGAAFGGAIVPAPTLMHGKLSAIAHDGRGVFAGLPQGFAAVRYHSLAAVAVPDVLEVSATSEGVVMGVRHRTLPLESVQFHPESVLSEHGARMVTTFLEAA